MGMPAREEGERAEHLEAGQHGGNDGVKVDVGHREHEVHQGGTHGALESWRRLDVAQRHLGHHRCKTLM